MPSTSKASAEDCYALLCLALVVFVATTDAGAVAVMLEQLPRGRELSGSFVRASIFAMELEFFYIYSNIVEI